MVTDNNDARPLETAEVFIARIGGLLHRLTAKQRQDLWIATACTCGWADALCSPASSATGREAGR